MKTVTICLNPLDPESWVTTVVNDGEVLDFVMGNFTEWPAKARLYCGNVSQECDVTPTQESDFAKIEEMDGPFWAIVYPGTGYEEIVYIIIILVVAAVAIYAMSNVPHPNPNGLANNQPSPNNDLSDRTNKARPNERIPDIFGTVRSTPDLIAVPYKFFDNNVEVEIAYMCIGRGYYDVSDIRDDTTLFSDIDSAQIAVIDPNGYPNVGTGISGPNGDAPVQDIKRYTSVNGQTVNPPDFFTFIGDSNTHIDNDTFFGLHIASGVDDFTKYFSVGDTVNITNLTGHDPDIGMGGADVSLNGNGYILDSVSATQITFSNALTINSNWSVVLDTGAHSPHIANAVVSTYIGPFIMDKTDATILFLNFVAPNGLYTEDSTGLQLPRPVSIQVEYWNVDASGTQTGTTITTSFTMQGAPGNPADQVGYTYSGVITLSGAIGRVAVQVKRLTYKSTFVGTTVEEVKWRDLYGANHNSLWQFGDCTTVLTRTVATEGALAVKERKLNALVTRKIPQRISGSTFTTTLYPTNDAAEIISAVCLDPRIGNRQVSEIDFDGIYTTVAAVATYFGTTLAKEFCYTFDTANTSFEETLTYIANAIFCSAFRRGNIIGFSFEKKTTDSTMLFNHRNKLPNSETRSVRFGNSENLDGVNFLWTDPTQNDLQVTMYLPTDQSAINPKEIKSVGVRNKNQAWMLACRAWNKIRYQNISTEFIGLQEADLLVKGDRILVADNTRQKTFDGEVLAQSGLLLTLSQDFDWTNVPAGQTASIFLQLPDQTVQAINISQGTTPNTVTLASAPRLTLATRQANSDNYAICTYQITWTTDVKVRSFLVAEKQSKDNFTSKVSAMNYDDRYYANDTDYINGLIP